MNMLASTRIARGFNHNVVYEGVLLHVQTEASVHDDARVDTHVFVGGRIIVSRTSKLAREPAAVACHMKEQHRAVLRDLLRGQLALPRDLFSAPARVLAQPVTAPARPVTAPPPRPPSTQAARPRPASGMDVQLQLALLHLS